jgi:hypothetical protein
MLLYDVFHVSQVEMRHHPSETKKKGSKKGLLKILKTLSEEVRDAIDSGEIDANKRPHARALLVQTYLLLTNEEKFDTFKAKRLARELDRVVCGDAPRIVLGKKTMVFTDVSSGVVKNTIEQRLSQLETSYRRLTRMAETMLKQTLHKRIERSSRMAEKAVEMEIVSEEPSKE